jgi:predicted CoA-binding protein
VRKIKELQFLTLVNNQLTNSYKVLTTIGIAKNGPKSALRVKQKMHRHVIVIAINPIFSKKTC